MNNLFKITEDNLKNFLLFDQSIKSKNKNKSKKIILDENNDNVKNKKLNNLHECEREIIKEKKN